MNVGLPLFLFTFIVPFDLLQSQSSLPLYNTFPGRDLFGVEFVSSTNSESCINHSIEGVCEAFFKTYINASGGYVECELRHSRPFRVCTKCVSEWAVTYSTYSNISVSF